jgi:acetyltransferase
VITPYPTRYVRPWTLPDGRPLLLRPVKPEDAPLVEKLYASVSEAAFFGRFFHANKNTSPGMCIRDCSVDYDREIGIVAEEKENGIRRIVGFGMLMAEPGQKRGEYSILVHDDYQGQGLGYMLIDMLIGIAHEKGLKEIFGVVLANNIKMLNVIKMLGFTIEGMPDGLKKVNLLLE